MVFSTSSNNLDHATRTPKAIDFSPGFSAVLCADVVGYSRLMEIAGLETHRRFRALHVNVIDPLILSFRGNVVKGTGDGFIAVFDVASDALACAVEMQRQIADVEADIEVKRALQFRMAIHWGQMIRDMNDVFGHTVNVAVRLQEYASAGGIVVSRDFHAAIGPSAGLITTDLGPLQLKNIREPVPAAHVGSVGDLIGAAAAGSDAPAVSAVPSIALLPFENLTEDPATRHMVAGFVDDIITSLSNLKDIFTVARGSTIAVRPGQLEPDEIVAKLGVQYLFTGRVHRRGDRWRLSVELLNAASAEVIWAEHYEIVVHEVFDLQDEITLAIVGQIASRIRVTEVQRAMRKPPQSLTAYDCYLQALNLMYRLRPDEFRLARKFLDQATREDPDYAAPFSLAAHWHMFCAAEGWSDDPDSDIRAAISNANRAIERDDSAALAHALLGHAEAMFNRDIISGIDSVDRARAISPNNSWAWTFSSGPYGFAGDTATAIKYAERALRLSPIDQHAFFKQCLLAQNHYLHGNFVEATAWARRSLSVNPRFGNAARVLIASLVAGDDMENARKAAAHHRDVAPAFRLSEYRRRCPFREDHARLYIERLLNAGVSE